jgi:hypothetical protein
MRPDDLKSMLDKRPFEPFRLLISGGQHADVMHPEMAIVGRSIVAVGEGRKGGVAERIVWYNLLHIVKIEPLTGRTRGNGRRRKAG